MNSASEPFHYPIPAGPVTIELEIKRSRFVTDIAAAATRAEAMAFIDHIKLTHPDASHHCWAYIAGHPESSSERASSDDGEPQGTAGKPMLHVLQHKNIGDIVVVISRYFGGIKLGSGGLVRAYGSAVQHGVDALSLTRRVTTRAAMIHIPFALENTVRRLLQTKSISIKQVDYQTEVIFTVAVPCGDETSLLQEMINQTNGAATIIMAKKE
ncbi:YigZ family protein [Mariprofundus erugo]|uniref:YigZ family protein n=1 Tax=Mariprofundus erugo TaxID=2528639 RepID=UPI0010FD7924|nr:YigZ family protein [Mariprofundus erugo]TLS76703.1 YigZ family protein [Mariprofundus erugo]